MTPVYTLKEYLHQFARSTVVGYQILGERIGEITQIPSARIHSHHETFAMNTPSPETKVILASLGAQHADTQNDQQSAPTLNERPTLYARVDQATPVSPFVPPSERLDLLSEERIELLRAIDHRLHLLYRDVTLVECFSEIANVERSAFDYGLFNNHRVAKFCQIDEALSKPGQLFSSKTLPDIEKQMALTRDHYRTLITTCLVELQLTEDRHSAKLRGCLSDLKSAIGNYANALVQSGLIGHDSDRSDPTIQNYCPDHETLFNQSLERELKYEVNPLDIMKRIEADSDKRDQKILRLFEILNPSQYEIIRAQKGLIPRHEINGRADYNMQPCPDEFKKLARASRADPTIRRHYFNRIVESFIRITQGAFHKFETAQAIDHQEQKRYIELRDAFFEQSERLFELAHTDQQIKAIIEMTDTDTSTSRNSDPIYHLEDRIRQVLVDAFHDKFGHVTALSSFSARFQSQPNPSDTLTNTALRRALQDTVITTLMTTKKLHQGGQIETPNETVHPSVHSRRIQAVMQKMQLYRDIGEEFLKVFEQFHEHHGNTDTLDQPLSLDNTITRFETVYHKARANHDPIILRFEGKIEKILRSNDRDDFLQVFRDIQRELVTRHCQDPSVAIIADSHNLSTRVESSLADTIPNTDATDSRPPTLRSYLTRGNDEYEIFLKRRAEMKSLIRGRALVPKSSSFYRNAIAKAITKHNISDNTSIIRGNDLCHESDIQRFMANLPTIMGLISAYQQPLLKGTAMVHDPTIEHFRSQMFDVLESQFHVKLVEVQSPENQEQQWQLQLPDLMDLEKRERLSQSVTAIFEGSGFRRARYKACRWIDQLAEAQQIIQNDQALTLKIDKRQLIESLIDLLVLQHSDNFVASTINKEVLDRYFIHSISDPEQASTLPLFSALRGDPEGAYMELINIAHIQSANPYSKAYFGTWQPAVILAQNFGFVHATHTPWMVAGIPVFNLADIVNSAITSLFIVPPVAIAKALVLEAGLAEKKRRVTDEAVQSMQQHHQTSRHRLIDTEARQPEAYTILNDPALRVEEFGQRMRSGRVLRFNKAKLDLHAQRGSKSQWAKDGNKAASAIVGAVVPGIIRLVKTIGGLGRAAYTDTLGTHSARAMKRPHQRDQNGPEIERARSSRGLMRWYLASKRLFRIHPQTL